MAKTVSVRTKILKELRKVVSDLLKLNMDECGFVGVDSKLLENLSALSSVEPSDIKTLKKLIKAANAVLDMEAIMVCG